MPRRKRKARRRAGKVKEGNVGNSKSARGSAKRKSAQKAGFRSGYEHDIAKNLEEDGIAYEYEPKDAELEWTPKKRKYLVDFVLENGVWVEAKGRLTVDDRNKMISVKQQHPDIDIRFLFAKNNPISPRSKTRYTDWAKKHGFMCAVGTRVPKEWVK